MPDFSPLTPEQFRAELDKIKTAVGPNVGLTIVELPDGGWSGDAPAGRTGGANPVWFIPADPNDPTDPADETNGIATPANIREWDFLGPVTVGSL